jgi:hypothetical protein
MLIGVRHGAGRVGATDAGEAAGTSVFGKGAMNSVFRKVKSISEATNTSYVERCCYCDEA